MSDALPDLDFEPLRPFWAGAAAGELRIPRCTQCASWIWYPRDACPHCRGTLAWTPTSGRGSLFSFAVVRRALWAPYAPFVPYATGLVALEEDPNVRIVTHIVDCDLDRLEIDTPMHVVFASLDAAERIRAPFFTPISDAHRARAGTGGSEEELSGRRRTPRSRSAPPSSPKEQLR